ncbi:MAG: T9SS type A sorting domain-containing protein [Caldithrix sp.]|nr:T9SS type A sorting domain-containing protein [Caldithrix sp.]
MKAAPSAADGCLSRPSIFESGVQPVVEIGTNGVPGTKTVAVDGVMLLLNRRFSPEVLVGIESEHKRRQLPEKIKLHPNYPNPFNPQTTINFSLPEAGHVQLSVYDTNGRLVQTLINGYKTAGTHRLRFNGSDLASGLYLLHLRYGNVIQTQKMLLVR